MRQIVKGKEPASLKRHRAIPHANYDNYKEKDELRECLVREQYGLCCYCLARIRPAETEMKIEHWRCQDRHDDLALAFSNLLGACLGGEGTPGKEQHCDTRKGAEDLRFNPADPAHKIESKIRFTGSGEIKSSDKGFNEQLRRVLNLNTRKLKNARKAVIDAFFQRLARLDPVRIRDLTALEMDYTRELADGYRREFYPVVVYLIRKKRKQLE